MSTISKYNSKSGMIQSKPSSNRPSPILEYNFLKSKKSNGHITQNESLTDLSSNTKITNQSFNKDHSRDKSAPTHRSSSFQPIKHDSFYNKSKEQQLLHKRKIDYQRNLNHQKELREQRSFVPLNDISRELYKNQMKRSKSVMIPIYKRPKEKINLNNTRNLKQLIINEANTSSLSRNTRCFQKKVFNNWLQKNELWKKNSMTKTINKVKTRMIEINEQEEQFQFKPQLNHSNSTIQCSKSRNKCGNNLSTASKSMKTNHSVSSLKKEYDKIKIMPSFKPVINATYNSIKKKPLPISIKTNFCNLNKEIQLKSQPIKSMNKIHVYCFDSYQNEDLVIKKAMIQSRISNKTENNDYKISEDLYKINVRDKLPNNIPLNVIFCKNHTCL